MGKFFSRFVNKHEKSVENGQRVKPNAYYVTSDADADASMYMNTAEYFRLRGRYVSRA